MAILPGIFGQGSFQNTANMTPDQIERKRAYIAAMMPRFGSAKYVGEGLGQLATGFAIRGQNKKLDAAESAGRQSADDMFSRLFGTANSAQSSDMAPLSVLGMQGPAITPVDPSNPEAIASDAMTALGKGATPEGIKAGLVARGMPEHIADGFVMNFQDESGLNPGINEQNPTVPGSRGGFGLAQWTGPRRKALEAFAAERGMPVSDPGVQMDFLMTELQGPEAAAWAKISGAKNAGEAGAAIVNDFLRPAEEHRASRAAEYLGGGGMPASGNAATGPTSAPQIDVNELYMALQNPWLSAEQKGLITSMIGEQQAASDPMKQIELEKAQLELAQMKNPTEQPPEDFTARMFTLNSLGIDPQSEEGKVYIMTGQLPEAPEAGYTTMTADEVAQLGLPPGAYQKGPKGEIKQIGGGGTNVTVNNGGGAPPDDEELRKKLAGKEGESWASYMDSGTTSSSTLQDMQLLDELITLAPQGPISGRLAGAFPGVNSAADAFTSVVKRVAPTLRAPGSGATSDIEYEGMLKSLPQLSSKPEANAAISGMMKAKAQLNIERGNVVAQYQNGEIDAKAARDKMKEINSRSIMTPELEAILKATGPAPDAPVASTPAPSGIDQETWDALTPEEKALWD